MKFLNEDRLDSECKLVVFGAMWRNPHATTAELAQELVDYCAYYTSDDAMALILGARPMPSLDEGRPGL